MPDFSQIIPSGMTMPRPPGAPDVMRALDGRQQQKDAFHQAMQDYQQQRPVFTGGDRAAWQQDFGAWRAQRPDHRTFMAALSGQPASPPVGQPVVQSPPAQMPVPPTQMPVPNFAPQVGTQLGVIGAQPGQGQYGLPTY